MRYHFKTIGKITFILLTLFQPIYSQAQKTLEPIVIGEKLTIHSTILNEDRELWIYKPVRGRYPCADRFFFSFSPESGTMKLSHKPRGHVAPVR